MFHDDIVIIIFVLVVHFNFFFFVVNSFLTSETKVSDVKKKLCFFSEQLSLFTESKLPTWLTIPPPLIRSIGDDSRVTQSAKSSPLLELRYFFQTLLLVQRKIVKTIWNSFFARELMQYIMWQYINYINIKLLFYAVMK